MEKVQICSAGGSGGRHADASSGLLGTEEPTAEARASEESFDLEAEERRMEELLGRIDGVGKLRLMLTLQSGTRLTLAEDSQKTRIARSERR